MAANAAASETVHAPPRTTWTRSPSVPASASSNPSPTPTAPCTWSRGITGAFLGGKHKNLGEEQSLYQWQGELGYYYTPYFSGGVGFKITAGEPSDSAQKIFNRYFLNVRLHQAWDKVAVYAGLQLGMGNLNILTGSPTGYARSGSRSRTPSPPWAWTWAGAGSSRRYLGLTLGNNLEYSLVDEEGVGVSNALNIHVNPGLALDLLAFTDSLRELVPALYVYVEFQRGYPDFRKGEQACGSGRRPGRRAFGLFRPALPPSEPPGSSYFCHPQESAPCHFRVHINLLRTPSRGPRPARRVVDQRKAIWLSPMKPLLSWTR